MCFVFEQQGINEVFILSTRNGVFSTWSIARAYVIFLQHKLCCQQTFMFRKPARKGTLNSWCQYIETLQHDKTGNFVTSHDVIKKHGLSKLL